MLPSVGLVFLLAAGKDLSGQNLYFNGYDRKMFLAVFCTVGIFRNVTQR